VDIYLPELNTIFDVQISNDIHGADKVLKLASKEQNKYRLHLKTAEELGLHYFPPTFGSEGSPSLNTVKELKSIFNKYLDRLDPQLRKAKLRSGSSLSWYLNLISFTINKYKASKALEILPQISSIDLSPDIRDLSPLYESIDVERQKWNLKNSIASV